MQGADTPVTTPSGDTVAQGTELCQMPPPVVPSNVVVAPTHTEVAPDIEATGAVITEIIFVAVAVPHTLVTV